MIKSMTGYGKYESITETSKLVVEMKSINHRYLEMNIRIPRKLNFMEPAIRNTIKKYITRGKVDIFISYEDYSGSDSLLRYNKGLASDYLERIKEINSDFSLDDSDNLRINALTLSKYQGVLTLEESSSDEEDLIKIVEEGVGRAASNLVENREREGNYLKKDILDKLNNLRTWIEDIEKRSPDIMVEYKKRLLSKVNETLQNVGVNVDESRIATEVVLYSDKICTDEEVVRLKSHIKHMEECLGANDDSLGRKLDFISQELNREANTILSKANDITVSELAISIKTEIEKIREQIQNIE